MIHVNCYQWINFQMNNHDHVLANEIAKKINKKESNKNILNELIA